MDGQITEVAIDVLKVHPRNQEFFDDIGGSDYTNFKESIKNEGIISEIVVAADMTILSGHQRYKAAKELGMTKVPVRIRSDIDSDDDKLKILLAANFGRSSNDPAKQRKVAAEYVALCGYNNGGDRKAQCQNGSLKLSDIATQLGTTERSLARSLRIERNLSEPMKQLLDDGVITATFAADVIATMTEEEQLDLISSLDITKKYKANELKPYIDKIKRLEDNVNKQNTPNEVVKEILPSDYEAIKSRLAQLEIENLDLRSASTKQINIDDFNYKVSELNDTILSQKSIIQQLTEENRAIKEQSVFDKNTIDKLRNEQYSGPAQEANSAYDFFKTTERFVKEIIAPFHYDEIIDNNQNSICGDYIVRACNLLIDSANDILRRFKTTTIDSEVIDIE